MDWGKAISTAESVLSGIEQAVKIAEPILEVAVPGSSVITTIGSLVTAGMQFTQSIMSDAQAAGEIASATNIDTLRSIVGRYETLNDALGAQIASGN